MAAAREDAVEFHADGSVTLGGRDARAGRGRDPRDAAARHGRRRTTRASSSSSTPSSRRSSSPKATPASCSGRSRTSARTPASSSTTGSSCGSTDAADDVARVPRRGRRGDPRRQRRRSAVAGRRRPVDPRLGSTSPPGPSTIWHPPPATERMSRRPIWPLFLGLAALVVVLDQLTKAWLTVVPRARARCESVVGDFIRLVHGQNNGALFGLFRDSALLFGIVSLGVIGLIVGYHARAAGQRLPARSRSGCCSAARSATCSTGSGSATSSTSSTLGIGTFRWYTFNVADAAISLSIVLLVLARDPAVARGHDAAATRAPTRRSCRRRSRPSRRPGADA